MLTVQTLLSHYFWFLIYNAAMRYMRCACVRCECSLCSNIHLWLVSTFCIPCECVRTYYHSLTVVYCICLDRGPGLFILQEALARPLIRLVLLCSFCTDSIESVQNGLIPCNISYIKSS